MARNPRAPVGRLSDRTSETSKPAARAQLLLHSDGKIAEARAAPT